MATIKRVSIYDMDGTIVCSLHRYKTLTRDDITKIDLQHWRDNSHLAMNDKLLPLAKQYQTDLTDKNCYVIIATARVMGNADFKFVSEILGNPNHLISRHIDDTKGGADLKIAGLQKFFNLKNFNDADFVFYEDNIAYLKKVCDYFNIRGVYIPSNQGH